MIISNPPKALILLVGLLCLTVLMLAGKIDMDNGVPILTLCIGYGIGNGVQARTGGQVPAIFSRKPDGE